VGVEHHERREISKARSTTRRGKEQIELNSGGFKPKTKDQQEAHEQRKTPNLRQKKGNSRLDQKKCRGLGKKVTGLKAIRSKNLLKSVSNQWERKEKPSSSKKKKKKKKKSNPSIATGEARWPTRHVVENTAPSVQG